MERSKIAGMRVDEYRAWMKDDLSDLYLINNAEPVDDIVKNMKNPHLMLSSVNDDEYEGYASSIDNFL